MTDLPEPAADPADEAPIPDSETPAGDPELAALVATAQSAADPDVADVAPAAAMAAADDAAAADPTVLGAVASSEPTDEVTTDTTTTFEAGVDAVPVLPLAAAVTDGEPARRPRRRRSLVLRFGVSFALAFLLAFGVGAGALYAWSSQYDGRVLPGVSVGSTGLGGLTREQASAAITDAYASLGTGQITLTGPDGQATTISYTDVGRGP